MSTWGVCLGPAWNTSLADLVPWAQQAESAGFSRVATGEFHSDSLSWAALLAAATRRVRIATTIASIASRHPTVVAEAVAAIRDVHGDRVELGLGVSHPSMVVDELGLKQPGLDELEAYVTAVRRTLEGRTGTFGPYRVPRHERSRWVTSAPRILVAALGEYAVLRAATYADGIILTWTPRAWTEKIIELVRSRDAVSGRSTKVWSVIPTFVDDDLDRARRACAEALQPYLRLPSYQAMLAAALGDPHRVTAAAEAQSSSKVIDLLGVATLEHVAAVGSPAHVRAAIEANHRLGVDEVILYPLSTGDGWQASVNACITRCPPTG